MPHEAIAGGGSDLLGNFELHSGRRFTESDRWLYPLPPTDHAHPTTDPPPRPPPHHPSHPILLSSFSASPIPHPHLVTPTLILAYVRCRSVEWVKTYSTLHPAFAQHDAATGAECGVQVYCRGSMDGATRAVSGEWHMCVRMGARAYRNHSHATRGGCGGGGGGAPYPGGGGGGGGGRSPAPRGTSLVDDGSVSWR